MIYIFVLHLELENKKKIPVHRSNTDRCAEPHLCATSENKEVNNITRTKAGSYKGQARLCVFCGKVNRVGMALQNYLINSCEYA